MRIDITELLDGRQSQVSFDFSVDLQTMQGMPKESSFLAPVPVYGSIKKSENRIMITGEGMAKLSLLCDRCLSPVAVEVALKIDETLSIHNSEEERSGIFSQNGIDMDMVVQEVLLASLPMKVVCSQDCKGLCPKCGKNLNQGNCSCSKEEIDPRFEGLRAFFKLDEEV